jgi:hypothetical protein
VRTNVFSELNENTPKALHDCNLIYFVGPKCHIIVHGA